LPIRYAAALARGSECNSINWDGAGSLRCSAARPAVARPVMSQAQQQARLRTVGFLGAGTPATAGVWISAFTARLRELGWIEDRNVKIDLRWAEGRPDRSAEIATEFVQGKVDVIVTYSSEHVQIAKEATSTIPIVFATAGDPVGSGLVGSLAHPGGNLTGMSSQNDDLTGKRFELLSEIVPSFRRLAVLFNGNHPAYRLEADTAGAVATRLGFEALSAEVRAGEEEELTSGHTRQDPKEGRGRSQRSD
jgi:putative ABC transport system substrate-binding protein